MNPGGRITIVTVTDEHYLILLAALLKSIEVNHLSQEFIDFYIVGDNINEINKRKFNSSFVNEKINIIWIDMKKVIPNELAFSSDNTSYPLNIYARLFFPSFITNEVEKLLYLDVDMIVLNDISKLYFTELREHPIGAVVDPKIKTFNNEWGGIKNYNELKINGDTAYFNTGMLLIDVQKWKDLNIMQKAIDCINQNKAYLNYPDQYALNVVLVNNWLHIDSSWNTFAVNSSNINPNIIHFTERKPIYKSYNYNTEFQDYFFSYLEMTAWRKFKLIGEKKRYFKKLNNILSKRILKIFGSKSK